MTRGIRVIRVLELFSGIGSQTQALKNIGVEHTTTQCEIDKHAITAYNQLHGVTPNLGDISKINPDELQESQWDLITYSFPCTDISLAGHQEGLAKDSGTRSSLLWECEKIFKKVKPKYLLMENVKNLVGKKFMPYFEDWLKVLEDMGYKNYWKVLNAKDFGIPQNRERVFCVSILGEHSPYIFPEGFPLPIQLKDILDDTVEDEYYMDENYVDDEDNGSYRFYQQAFETLTSNNCHVGDTIDAFNKRVNTTGVCPTLTTRPEGFKTAILNVVPSRTDSTKLEMRKLTTRECWRLMGWKDDQIDMVHDVPKSQLYKQAGNSIVIPVLENIFKKLFQKPAKHNVKLFNNDSIKVLQELLDSGVKVDCIITDPPYRTISGGRNDKLSQERWWGSVLDKNDGKIFEHNDIDHEKWLKLCYDILRDDAQIYIMTNLLNLFELKELAEKVGFKLHNLLIWEKNNSTPNKWYMKNCEYTLFMRKGKAFPIYNMGSKTVHQFDNILGTKIHPTQKPVDLMEYYLLNSSKEGETVMDPFMGSGTTGVAAVKNFRNFIGIEIDKTYFDTAVSRIRTVAQEVKQQTQAFDSALKEWTKSTGLDKNK